MLNYSDNTLATQFSTSLFYKDTSEEYETELKGKNRGLRRWMNLSAQSRKIAAQAALQWPLFKINLLNGMDLNIKLTHGKETFCLNACTQEFTRDLLVGKFDLCQNFPHMEFRNSDACVPCSSGPSLLFWFSKYTQVSKLCLCQLPRALSPSAGFFLQLFITHFAVSFH